MQFQYLFELWVGDYTCVCSDLEPTPGKVGGNYANCKYFGPCTNAMQNRRKLC